MGEMVTFEIEGGSTGGYVALPESGSGPGVILEQEWWGLVGHATAVADRLSEEGFVVLAIRAAVAGVEAGGGQVEVVDYPGTRHAFFNDERPHVYDEAAAKEARRRTVEFLHTHLG